MGRSIQVVNFWVRCEASLEEGLHQLESFSYVKKKDGMISEFVMSGDSNSAFERDLRLLDPHVVEGFVNVLIDGIPVQVLFQCHCLFRMYHGSFQFVLSIPHRLYVG